MTDEIEVTHKGEAYWVEVEFERHWVDDSFDHDWGGRRQTEECGHWEVDRSTVEVTSCTDGTGAEVDPCPALFAAIVEKLEGMDP